MSISIVNNQKSVLITDKEKVDKLVSIVNSHTFIRSAKRTIRQQDFADSQCIMIGTLNEQPWRLIQLYVLKDNSNKDALEINGQIYNAMDKWRISEDIFNALKEFGVL
jgi:stress response protein SCP2